jgi:hypothetical protein
MICGVNFIGRLGPRMPGSRLAATASSNQRHNADQCPAKRLAFPAGSWSRPGCAPQTPGSRPVHSGRATCSKPSSYMVLHAPPAAGATALTATKHSASPASPSEVSTACGGIRWSRTSGPSRLAAVALMEQRLLPITNGVETTQRPANEISTRPGFDVIRFGRARFGLSGAILVIALFRTGVRHAGKQRIAPHMPTPAARKMSRDAGRAR